jgi:pimeloyl-ACP methyl ester carboxylesterase
VSATATIDRLTAEDQLMVRATLATGITGAQLRIIERAGHNAHDERPTEVLAAVERFILTA